jgi:glucose-1-phosphate thymidylyltransferase
MKLCGVVVVEDFASSRLTGGRSRLPAVEHVANRPILEHVIDALHLAGVEEVVVAMSAAVSGDIRRHLGARNDVAIRYLEEEKPLDLAAAIRLAAPVVGDGPCIVHRATGLLDEPLSRFVTRLRHGPDVLLIVHQASSPDEHLSTATQDMLHLAEFNPEHALGMAGVWLLGPGAMPIVASSPWPVGRDVDLTSLGAQVRAAGGGFHVELADTWRQYRGHPLELLELNRIVLDRLQNGVRRPVNNGNRIEGRVWIHEAASVRGSVIVGPAVIGAGARIADAYIGPYTSVGERARVEGAEVERSIICAGARVQHVGGRLVASVVGRDARVFRDFSLPRALRLRVGDGTEVALC